MFQREKSNSPSEHASIHCPSKDLEKVEDPGVADDK